TLLERVFVVDAGGFPDYGQWFEQTWTDLYSALYSYQSLSNLPFVLGGNYAYFGFTGATGGYTAEQQVSNFFLNGQRMSFSTGEPETPPDNAAPVADAGGPYAIAEGES